MTLAGRPDPVQTCRVALLAGSSGRLAVIVGRHASGQGVVAHCALLVGEVGRATSRKGPAWKGESCMQVVASFGGFLGNNCARLQHAKIW